MDVTAVAGIAPYRSGVRCWCVTDTVLGRRAGIALMWNSGGGVVFSVAGGPLDHSSTANERVSE
jgi:hypothetical protein